jgi:hypothetical protein
MKSNLMVLTTFKYRQGPLMAPYMLSMSHNNGVVTNLGGELVLEIKEYYLNDNESGVGGLITCIPHLVKPMVIVTMFLIFRSCGYSIMNPTLGVQLKFFDNQGLMNMS